MKYFVLYTHNYDCDEEKEFNTEAEMLEFVNSINWNNCFGTYGPTIFHGHKIEIEEAERVKYWKVKK